MSTPAIGPVHSATIFSRHYKATIDSWCNYLAQRVHSEGELPAELAQAMRYPDLRGSRVTWLANELGEPWLRIIDSPNSPEREAFTQYGWLSLEISVSDVDALFKELANSPFKIIGEPADLDVSDAIRAMQIVGLDGDVSYLTQVNDEVPPFELPFARCYVDRLFIPVEMVPSREQALNFYRRFDHTDGLQFDTKITVINNALGFDLTRKHPVATVQLAGKNLVELDEINGLQEINSDTEYPAAGIGMVSFEVDALSESPSHQLDGRNCLVTRGAANELVELIERA